METAEAGTGHTFTPRQGAVYLECIEWANLGFWLYEDGACSIGRIGDLEHAMNFSPRETAALYASFATIVIEQVARRLLNGREEADHAAV